MEQKLDNPAGRLHVVLSKFKGIRGDEPTGEIWARALSVSAGNKTELMVRLGKIYALPSEIASKMKEVPGYHARDVTRWWKPLAEAFYEAHSGTYWNSVSRYFNSDILGDIESCSFKLSQSSPEPYLNQDEIEHIKGLLAEIKNDLVDDPIIDDALKSTLNDRLRRIEQAIQNVWVDGVRPVQTELEATVATVVVESQTRPPTAKRAAEVIGWSLVNILRVAQIWNMVHETAPALPFFTEPGPPAKEGTPTPELPEEKTLVAHVVEKVNDQT